MERTESRARPSLEWLGLRRFFARRALASRSDAEATGHIDSAAAAASDAMYREIAADVDSLLRLGPSDSLLDIGCGTGALLALLAPQVAQARGIDLSPAMVEAARSKGLAADRYDGGRLPYADGSFTAVIMFFVTINIPRRDLVVGLVDEAMRVTAPGGRLLVGASPHPVASGLRRTPSGSTALVRSLALGMLGRVGAYSIEPELFGGVLARHPGSESRFAWARETYPAGPGKYHMLLSKPTSGRARAGDKAGER